MCMAMLYGEFLFEGGIFLRLLVLLVHCNQIFGFHRFHKGFDDGAFGRSGLIDGPRWFGVVVVIGNERFAGEF